MKSTEISSDIFAPPIWYRLQRLPPPRLRLDAGEEINSGKRSKRSGSDFDAEIEARLEETECNGQCGRGSTED